MARVQFLLLLSCVLYTFRTMAQDNTSGFSCVMNCTFRHANAWASVLSLSNPSKTLMNWVQGIRPTLPPSVSPSNDSLSRVCDVYDSYKGCLIACPDDLFRTNVLGTINGLQMICTTQRKEVASNTMPCVQQFTSEIQLSCRPQNEELLSTTNQLQMTDRKTPAVNFVSLLQRLCEAALEQSRCVVPLLQRRCGDTASGLLNQLMTASLGSVEKLIGDKRDMMPVQCKELFNVIVTHDNGSMSVILPETTPMTTVPPLMEATTKPLASNPNATTPSVNFRQAQTTAKGSVHAPLPLILLLILCIIGRF